MRAWLWGCALGPIKVSFTETWQRTQTLYTHDVIRNTFCHFRYDVLWLKMIQCLEFCSLATNETFLACAQVKGNHDTQLKAQLHKLSKQHAEALSQSRDNHETQMKAAREHHEASAAGCMRLVLLKDSMLVMHSMTSSSAQMSMKV